MRTMTEIRPPSPLPRIKSKCEKYAVWGCCHASLLFAVEMFCMRKIHIFELLLLCIWFALALPMCMFVVHHVSMSARICLP